MKVVWSVVNTEEKCCHELPFNVKYDDLCVKREVDFLYLCVHSLEARSIERL
jgi:hypothetical protein